MGKSSRSRDSVRLGKENISNGKKWERRRNHPTALWEASSVQTRLTCTQLPQVVTTSVLLRLQMWRLLCRDPKECG